MLSILAGRFRIQNPDLSGLLRNLSWAIAARLLSMGSGLAISVLLARMLGPEMFGAYQYAWSMIAALGILATLGLDQIFIRDLVLKDRPAGEILTEAAALRGIGALAIVAICIALALLWKPFQGETGIVLCLMSLSYLAVPFQVSALYAQSRQDFAPVARARFWQILFSLAGRSVVILLYPGLPLLALWLLLDGVILAALLRYYIPRRMPLPGIARPRVAPVLATLRIGWPRLVAGVVFHLQAYMDVILLGHWMDKTAVGYYALGLQMVTFCGFVPMLLLDILFPDIVRAHRQGKVAYESRLLAFYRLIALVCLVVIPFLAIVVCWLIPVVYGQAYQPLAALMPLLACRFFFLAFDVVRAAVINTEDLILWSIVPVVCGLASNILLCWWLIPSYGMWGAAVASLLAYTLSTFLMDLAHPRLRPKVWLSVRAIATVYQLRLRHFTR